MPNQCLESCFGGHVPQLLSSAVGGVKVVFRDVALDIVPIVRGDTVHPWAGAVASVVHMGGVTVGWPPIISNSRCAAPLAKNLAVLGILPSSK